ncbi:MAG: M14 family zinc carboxypeptidase [Phycisphaerae bacterium]
MLHRSLRWSLAAIALSCAGGLGNVAASAQSKPSTVQPPAASTSAPIPAASQSAPAASQTAASAPARANTGYLSNERLAAALQEIAVEAGARAKRTSLVKTAGGEDVWMLELAAAGEPAPEKRPAILIVAGVDADFPAASEVALRMARRLSRESSTADTPVAKLLSRYAVVIVPRLNTDGQRQFFGSPERDGLLNARPVDDDRDGATDEDGPDDLDGDGVISVMRVRDPQGEWMVDPQEPRLMKRTDRARGERGVFKLMIEGKDVDGDGLINEDGFGGVDDDRNWPHFYEPATRGAGPHQLSEQETRALAQFVVDRPNIVLALVLGRYDNLVSVRKDDKRGPDGQSYRGLHPDDVKLFEALSERYKKISGRDKAGEARPEGALFAWLYSQRGIPTLANSVWWLPEEKPASQPAGGPASQPGGGAPSAAPAATGGGAEGEAGEEAAPPSLPPRERPPARPGRGGGRRGGGGPSGPGPGGPPAPTPDAGTDALAARVESTDANKAWLKYSDEKRGGSGFIAWHAATHPQLGQIELGGFRPYFKSTPQSEALDACADVQYRLLLETADLLPAVRFGKAKVRRAGDDLWDIELRIVNDGVLPTHLAISKHIQNPGLVLRPKIDASRVLGGRRQEFIDGLPGAGGAETRRWLIRGAAGERVEFTLFSRTYGEQRTQVELKETPVGEENE